MSQPVSFPSASPRHALPFLFVAQAQKEFFVNEALARIDMLLHTAVEGEADAPPVAPADGECWIVGSAPAGDWAGNAGALACWQSGNWLFATPPSGARVFDKATGQQAHFDNGWNRAAAVAAPAGGSVQDSEARTSIAGLIAALASAGILSGA